MKYVDEFRDPDMARHLIDEIKELTQSIEICKHRPIRIMEV